MIIEQMVNCRVVVIYLLPQLPVTFSSIGSQPANISKRGPQHNHRSTNAHLDAYLGMGCLMESPLSKWG